MLKKYIDPLKTKYKAKYEQATPTTRYMIIMLASLFCLFLFIFLFKMVKGLMIASQMAAMNHAVTVSTTTAHYEYWQPKIKATASLRAVRGVDVTTELAGLVKTIYFIPGADVKKDTLLIELTTDADVAQLHSLEAAAELAKVVFERDKAQFAFHAVSKATLDTDAANLKSQNALVAQQKATIAKKVIRAPFDGRLGISQVNPGQYLNTGDPITTLQSLDPIYIDFFIPQQSLVQLKVCQDITLTIDTYPKKIFKGKVTTINPKVDPATRNVAVEATVENPEHLLLPGMFGTTEVSTGKSIPYLTLPQTAISYNSYGNIVFIVKRSLPKHKKDKPILTVKQTFVTTGPTRGDQIAVLRGLKAGDVVVTAGQLKLQNNSEIIINNTVLPSNNPTAKVSNE